MMNRMGEESRALSYAEMREQNLFSDQVLEWEGVESPQGRHE